MLKQRIQSGVIMGVTVILAGLLLPPSLMALVIVLIGALGLYEFFKMVEHGGLSQERRTGLVGGIVLLLTSWAGYSFFTLSTAFGLEMAALVGVFLLVFLHQFKAPSTSSPMTAMAITLFGMLYVGFLFSFFIKLMLVWSSENAASGRWLTFFLIAVVKSGDTGAYFTGSKIGRRKLIPHISPNKTWEGCYGAVGAGLAASLLFLFFSRGSFGTLHFGFLDALALGIALPIMGILSDLTESTVKRAVGVKDSSRMVRGMGGILDIIDSLLFCAPLLFVYVWLFMS